MEGRTDDFFNIVILVKQGIDVRLFVFYERFLLHIYSQSSTSIVAT